MATSIPSESPAKAAGAARKSVALGFGLRLKITLSFFVFSALVSGLISWAAYSVLSDQLFRELQGRVLTLTRMGAMTLDLPALERLAGGIKGGIDEAEAERTERGTDYRKISDQLNAIRAGGDNLVRFTYLFVPTPDEGHARYLADADVLDLLGKRDRGEKVEDSEISGYGSDFDLSPFPLARRTIREGKSLVEPSYAWDPDFKVYSNAIFQFLARQRNYIPIMN
ncbi:MAG: hypothetical protein WCL50_06050 [Spirochaetota bacterium]